MDVLILSSSPRVLGSIAYESTGSGNFTGGNPMASALSPMTSLVSVSFNFATEPRSPALTSGTFAGVLPCISIRWPSRSGASFVLLWTVESAFSAPETTRNIVMRPANGSAIVFHTKTASGCFSSAARVVAAPSFATAAKGRSTGDGSSARIASSSCCDPTFSTADVQTSGKIFAAAVADRRPVTSSSSVSVPASKNFSISFSSFSATISTSASRAASTAPAMAAGTAPSVNAPLSSVLNVNAFFVTRSTTPLKFLSSPIGIWIGTMLRVNVSRSAESDRSRLARSRSIRLRTTMRGSDSSSAAAHIFSVCTIGPETASTTTSAPSATVSAARASARKFPMPGVSMRLIFCLFHSA